LLDDENDESFYVKLYELNQIQDRLAMIRTDFFDNLGAGAKKSSKSLFRPSAKNSTLLLQNINKQSFHHISSKMEPMTNGPYLRTEKEERIRKERDLNELNHGYGHTGSPFDHPYLQWMESLRKSKNANHTKQISEIKFT
jgi:hypothetical protein